MAEASEPERSKPPERLRTLPSPALIRAGLAGSLAAVLAVLVGRPQLLALGLPLLAWAIIAVVRRLARGERDGLLRPRVRSTGRKLDEGGTVAIAVDSSEDVLLGLSVPVPAHALLSPPLGSELTARSARLVVTAQRWGRYEIGPLHVALADALGAFRTQTTLPAVPLHVTPGSSLLEAPPSVPAPTGVAGQHLSRRRGEGTALADVREFQPGDRMHRINWPVTSRTGTLHTNATFTERDTDVLIVTDTLQEVVPTDVEDATSLDVTVRATAAIARHYLSVGDRVGVHDLGTQIGPVRAGTGPRQLRVLTETLSRAHRGDSRMSRIHRLGRVRTSTLVVVCTPLLAPGVLGQIGDLLALGADVIVVDTLPRTVGDARALGTGARRRAAREDRYWEEAWTLRRLQRERTVRELREQGVPVTVWEGPGSLAPVLLSLARAASAPRMRRS
ncbi:DUF58 domain-containing protein [Brachybacterium endophyticum]|uniref:DUF58 domain-containing protein n=1 Tax=Brachybacterium endophyticum TaxID=2182385 RepID=A0A2U2RPB7_9MICO|nr:DUF58 domain-containing protein [Brachybacterium endophyticum]PWH07681.1 DUF58 domain-containing protein [Brachybacterium endophyticum]